MSLDYVIHAPVPYRHRSAGFRALYQLASDLTMTDATVAITPLPMEFLSEFNDPCPYTIPRINQFTDEQISKAIHVVPEGVTEPPADKSVRWLLSDVAPVEGFLHFSWTGKHVVKAPQHNGRVTRKVELRIPRLAVDVIEKFLFYPGAEERSGLAIYSGKYGDLQINAMPGDTMITPGFPNTRAELADLLRSVEGLISYDVNSAINLEATICGTPVLMATGKMPEETLFGNTGIITSAEDFFEASEACKGVAEHYDEVRKEIAGDVDNFIELCNEEWQ